MTTIERYHLLLPPRGLGVHLTRAPVTASQALASSPGARVALDGVMFDNCDPAGRGYAASSCGDPDYLLFDARRGVYEPSGHPERGGTISVVGDRCVVSDGASVARGASVAVQAYPTLVRGGEVRSFGDERSRQRVWRAAVGSTRGGGRVLLAVALMPLGDFASWCADVGGEDVFYTDGGGSCRMQWPDGEWVGSAEDRRVPSFLLWEEPRLGAREASVAAALLIAVGAAGLAISEG